MPIKFDFLKFQTTHQGIVSKADVDPGNNQTVDDVQDIRDAESRAIGGFASQAEERIDVMSRTGAGKDQLLQNGETPVKTDNAYADFTRVPLSRNKQNANELEAMRTAFKNSQGV